MNTSPGQFPYISQYVYNPRRNGADRPLTLVDFANVLEAAVGLSPKERALLMMDVGGRMTRLLPKAEAKFRAKGLWPPRDDAPAAADAGSALDLRGLMGELDKALSAGGDEGMIAAFRAQLQSPAARSAYLSVLSL